DDDLHLVAQALWEERADLAVDDAGVKGALDAWATLAAHEGAWDLADGVVSLLVLDGEGEERDWRCAVAHLGGDEHQGIAVAHGDAASGLLGELAGLDDEFSPPELGGVATVVW